MMSPHSTRTTRHLTALLFVVAAACADFAGPLPPTGIRVATDRDVYDATTDAPPPGDVVIAMSNEFRVEVRLEILNRGQEPLALSECDWGNGPELLSSLQLASDASTWEVEFLMGACPDLRERILIPGQGHSATVRLWVSSEGSDEDRLHLLIATRGGPIRSETFRIRVPGPRTPRRGAPVPPSDRRTETTGTTTIFPP